MYDYDAGWPDYCYEDNEYTFCEDITEAKVLRLLKTYADFALRYTQQPVCRTFRPEVIVNRKKKRKTLKTFRNSRFYKPFRKLVDALGDRDPAHYVSFVFETWGNRDFYAKYLFHEVDERRGIAFPSLSCVVDNYDADKDSDAESELVPQFLESDFTYKSFVPIDDLVKRDKKMLENKVRQWCITQDKPPEDYWRVMEHLFPPHLSARYIPYFDSLKEHEWVIKEEFDLTIKDLLRDLPDIEGLSRVLPKVESIPDEVMFWDDPWTLERINLTKEALSKGVDVGQPHFQEWLDDEVRRI